MANNGKNKGQRLKDARQRFAAMLIQEVHDITGLDFARIDRALSLESGMAYKRFHMQGPNALLIQDLENRVAKFLGRPSHRIIVINRKLGFACVGTPGGKMDKKNFLAKDFFLAYDDEFPTYGSMNVHKGPSEYWPPISELIKSKATQYDWSPFLSKYSWQWAILWDQVPWLLKSAHGIKSEEELSKFIEQKYFLIAKPSRLYKSKLCQLAKPWRKISRRIMWQIIRQRADTTEFAVWRNEVLEKLKIKMDEFCIKYEIEVEDFETYLKENW